MIKKIKQKQNEITDQIIEFEKKKLKSLTGLNLIKSYISYIEKFEFKGKYKNIDTILKNKGFDDQTIEKIKEQIYTTKYDESIISILQEKIYLSLNNHKQ